MKYIYISILLLISCSDEQPIKVKAELEKPIEEKAKFRTYKNQVPMMNTGREKLERLSDVQDATRNILKTFDNHKPRISSNSEE